MPGYGVVGTLLLGLMVQGTGGDWIEAWVKPFPINAAISGYALGQLSIFSSLPFSPLFSALHVIFHKKKHRQQQKRNGEVA